MLEYTFSGSKLVKAIARLSSAELDKDKQYTLTLKEYKPKRSLDANALAWVLIDKLASRLHESKEEIYRGYIREMGGVSEIVCVKDKAVKKFCDNWDAKGIGWQTETMPSKIDGCTNVVVYYGSSTFTTEEMSRLIELIIEDCRALEIDTTNPKEIERLLAEWEDK